MPAKQMTRRQRNPRGQGERLRDDIIEAASRLLADPAAPPLTLRAVAREVGVAATSVYLHFDDIESLTLAVADRRFSELVRLQDEVRDGAADPCQRVRAGCLAYCEFGLAHPGHYQVMFGSPLQIPENTPPEQWPGWAPFQQLITAVGECREAGPAAGLLHRAADLGAAARPRQPAHLPAEVPLAAAGADGPHRGRPPARRGHSGQAKRP